MPHASRPAHAQAAGAYPHQLFAGSTWHQRFLPRAHQFHYAYRYWGVSVRALAAGESLPEVKSKWGIPLFSATRRAVQQFCPSDYICLSEEDDQSSSETKSNDKQTDFKDSYQAGSRSEHQALLLRLCSAFATYAGSVPDGDIMALVVYRNLGMYFSPVNFYIGFDAEGAPSHLLAEVSNTPWKKRHYYGFVLTGQESEFCHGKDFHVSPFNPIDQQYCWQVTVQQREQNEMAGLYTRIVIAIHDQRGEVMRAGVKLQGQAMTADNIQHSLRKNPLMNMTSLLRIYWHALKLYAIKRVPYVQYNQTLKDSAQHSKPQTEK
ncbi:MULTISPECIES: DUF1365 domain-containing protein [unclassified Psychrobacter]|uniref:DUF1365 domain-containing protein n=1 Tax=unclassified Psychrobacter TaxID=196806 RepID=UPI0018F33F0B|nr:MULTISPECIES: DUF1365 domain-containing protein [unclassified Psychrobacter]